MRGWQRVPTHELDDLSTRQYHEIANAHDPAGWESQRQAFTELRDLSEQLSQRCTEALSQLRRDWSGGGAEAFAAEFGKLIDLFTGLRDTAGTNAEGMRELATVAESTRDAAELLNEEDKAWQSNGDGDDEQTVTVMREGVRGELRDTIKETDESFQHLAQSYLLDPPQPVRLGGMETIVHGAEDRPHQTVTATAPETPNPAPATADTTLSATAAQAAAVEPAPSSGSTAPSLQTTPAHHAPAPVAEPIPTSAPAPVAEPAPAPAAPMMPMGGMGMGGHIPDGGGAGGAAPRSDGPKHAEGRPVESSRMRSQASRQELLNQSAHGQSRRPDPAEERRPVKAEDTESPFAPNDTPVVPPVISGGADYTGPHDSGPVLTGTVYRHFPEYGQNEPAEVITEDYEDGSSAVIEFGDDEPELAAPAPKPTATTRDDTAQAELDKRLFNTRVDGEEYLRVLQSLPREKAQAFIAEQARLRKPTPDDADPKPEPRKQTSLDELRRRRQERRQARKREPEN